MTVPDYLSPIIGYRVWRWNAAGLKSLKRAMVSGQAACGGVQGIYSGEDRGSCGGGA